MLSFYRAMLSYFKARLGFDDRSRADINQGRSPLRDGQKDQCV